MDSLDLNGIIVKFNELVESGNTHDLFDNAEVLKSSFYRILNEEREGSGKDMAEEEAAFKELYAKYKSIRHLHLQKAFRLCLRFRQRRIRNVLRQELQKVILLP